MPRDRRLQTVCQIGLDDPSKSLTLEQLSEEAGASSKTLARLCVTELGMGFSTWRRRVRFSIALELLAKGLPMKQIAARCGYKGPSAFSKEFGAPPSAYQDRR
ncbi:helix-turn-helix domain-containing protein [Roseovarius aestuarii]|uniref:helix-turn-helix domain-containing protein n=1 Tax=Roseovarius aestuarii TaxID=475083 RepID=UPI000A26D65A